jgi:acyl carrier protein
LEFLGRLDQQVKVRGYRIELGEIEQVLLAQPGVQDAVVVVREDRPGDQRLVAYVVPTAAVPVAEWDGGRLHALRQALRAVLPSYMVPSVLLPLAALPLSPNGKVDRRALPTPGMDRPNEQGSDYMAPQTDLEEQIQSVWQAVLAIRPVGREDNFFELGGNSFLLIQVHQQLLSRLGCTLTILDLFRYATIRSLANYLSTREASAANELDRQFRVH